MGDRFYRSKDPTNSIKVLKGQSATDLRLWTCLEQYDIEQIPSSTEYNL